FTTDEVKLAGLSTERSRRPSDMFRGRIMIPLQDGRGSVIGFTARLLADEPDSPKYINTPGTLVYDKSRHVFGLHLAKESIRRSGYVVVVEGNMDVIASHQAGVTNVVATAGTAITDRHLRELKRFTGDVRLSFDADHAGITATERAIPLAQKIGVNLSIITIDVEGIKDADELVQKDPKLWQKVIEEAKYAPDWLIEHYKKVLDLSSAQGKRAFTDALLLTIRRLSDSVEQEHYLKAVAEAADTSLESLMAKLRAGGEQITSIPRKKPAVAAKELDKNQLDHQKLQDHFLAMMLMQPKIRPILKGVEPEYFSDGPPRILLEFLKKNPDFKGEPSKDFIEVLAAKPEAASPTNPPKTDQAGKQLLDIADYVKIIALQFEELYQDLSLEDLTEQAAHLKQRLIERYATNQKVRLVERMQETTDDAKLQKLIKKVNQLNSLIK
ncbi:hypothetical protein BVY00_01965, partial [bacterium G20]